TLPGGQTILLNGNNIYHKKIAESAATKKSDPNAGLLGDITFDNWEGKSPYYPVKAKFQLWVNPTGKVIKSPLGKAFEINPEQSKLVAAVDVNVSRGGMKPALKLYHLTLCDNALSIALWFKSDQKSGMIFGKDGYNAFGKGYKTISCSMDNGRIVANPGRLTGGRIEPGTWNFLVLSADEKQMSLYLNGEKVASGQGTKYISTDAMDFFMDHQAAIGRLQLFNRPLDDQEVKLMHESGKK
ncbi:MAG: LamG-like jellyroll fold domain-containing protein, partial [Bacteroidales bacterium]